jgi:hypothetical protein
MRAGVASLPQSEGKSVRAARCPDGRKTAQRPPHQALPRSVVANVTRFLYLNRPLAASRRAPLAEAVISGHDDANHHHPPSRTFPCARQNLPQWTPEMVTSSRDHRRRRCVTRRNSQQRILNPPIRVNRVWRSRAFKRSPECGRPAIMDHARVRTE